jgi:hypothetical protein
MIPVIKWSTEVDDRPAVSMTYLISTGIIDIAFSRVVIIST